MKKQIAAGFFLFSFLVPLKASAATLTGLYVFGDSLGDQGNVLNTTTFFNSINPQVPIIPPAPFYSNGRFSNGFNWIDYLAQDLQLTPTLSTLIPPGIIPPQGVNYAHGGATTGTDNTIIPGLLPGLQQQIGAYTNSLLASNQTADQNALYIVWAGANDYLPTQSSFVPFTTPTQSITNIKGAVSSLATAGAKNIMVVNLPELGKVPLTRTTADADRLNELTKKHNQQLKGLKKSVGSDVNLFSLDINSLFNQVISNPGDFGFTNVTDSCQFNIGCFLDPNLQNQYFFWDQIHPTTVAHRKIADFALQKLEEGPSTSVPEPTSVLGILAFGAVGAGATLKRKSASADSASRF